MDQSKLANKKLVLKKLVPLSDERLEGVVGGGDCVDAAGQGGGGYGDSYSGDSSFWGTESYYSWYSYDGSGWGY